MDYLCPVESLIPGVQGRVLGVLARTDAELTIRAVASLANVSAQQASVVIGSLVSLGVVARREAGSAALVRLERENETARLVASLSQIRQAVQQRLSVLAGEIAPEPACLALFGSFARGTADSESDLDVLVVRPAGLAPDDDLWIDSLGRWESAARRVAGNPVNLLVVGRAELASFARSRSGPWRSIANDAVVLVGRAPSALASAA